MTPVTPHSKQLRIVVASESYRPSRGGTETTTENLARGLALLGHEVLVVAPGSSWRHSRLVEDDEGQRILRLRSRPNPIVPQLRASWLPYGAIERELNRFKPDTIQVNNHFGIGRALLRYGKTHQVPVVAGLHFMPETFLFKLQHLSPSLYQFWQSAWWRRIARIYNQASQVVAPSFCGISYLTQHGLTTPTTVISNGIDVSFYRPSSDAPAVARRGLGLPDIPTAMYVGRVSPEKQLQVLVQALARARQDHPRQELQLIIVGDGWLLPSLKRLAQRLQVDGRVIFTGFLQSDELKRRYVAAADLFVIPSTAELQSIVTLEAMAGGKPVLAVDAGALPELVRPGHNGELFAPGNSRQLSEILIELLQDLPRLKRYGQASLKDVQQHKLAAMPEHYAALYHQVLANRT